MPKYDYTNSTIDRSDKKRLHFYEELFTILEITESVNEEVNELIGWMGVVLGYYTRIPDSKEKDSTDYLKPDKKINDYTYIRNVSNQDIRLYSIISSIKECSAYNNNDSLSDITEKLYYLLDKVVHPYHRKNLDLEDVRFYVELEYINKEKQQEILKKHNIKYDDREV